MLPQNVKLLGIESGRGGRTPGAEDGPYVLRERGLVYRLSRLGHEVEDLGDIPGVFETRFASWSGPGLNHLPNILQVNRHTHACVMGTRLRSPRSFLVVIGGDHSLAIGTLAGLADACERLGILWLDAHADFNTPATSPSGNIHGMSLAVACGLGQSDLRRIARRDPIVDDEDVTLLGLRDVDAGEEENLRQTQVTRLTMSQWREQGITPTLLAACEQLARRCDHIHLSFDIDVLDTAIAPATGTPVPGGLTADEAIDLLTALNQQGHIRSAEFVEFNPELDATGDTAEMTIRLIETLLATP